MLNNKKKKHIIYDYMLKFLKYNNLIFPKQYGFRPGDSRVNLHLLSITHYISTSFDNCLEIRGVFLDISKPGLIKDKLLCLYD